MFWRSRGDVLIVMGRLGEVALPWKCPECNHSDLDLDPKLLCKLLTGDMFL